MGFRPYFPLTDLRTSSACRRVPALGTIAFVAAHPAQVASLSLVEPAWYLPAAHDGRAPTTSREDRRDPPAARHRGANGFRRLIVRTDVPLPDVRSDIGRARARPAIKRSADGPASDDRGDAAASARSGCLRAVSWPGPHRHRGAEPRHVALAGRQSRRGVPVVARRGVQRPPPPRCATEVGTGTHGTTPRVGVGIRGRVAGVRRRHRSSAPRQPAETADREPTRWTRQERGASPEAVLAPIGVGCSTRSGWSSTLANSPRQCGARATR